MILWNKKCKKGKNYEKSEFKKIMKKENKAFKNFYL